MAANCTLQDPVALALAQPDASIPTDEKAGPAGAESRDAETAESPAEAHADTDGNPKAETRDGSPDGSTTGSAASDAALRRSFDTGADVADAMLVASEGGDEHAVGAETNGCDLDRAAVTALAAGSSHTCARTSEGTVDCWGYNNDGEIGDGSWGNSKPTPSATRIASVRALAAGAFHTCALTASAGVRCWGNNSWGQLGIGADAGTMEALPPEADVFSGAQALAAGGSTTCALTTTGGVRCWGSNAYGELGDGTLVNRATAPSVDVPLGERATAIAAGSHHVCALGAAGGVRCWGLNLYGALGDGVPPEMRSSPNAASVLDDVQALAAGGYHTCALTRAGAVRCWGYNAFGQVGDGTTTDRHSPGPVVLTGVRAIAAGDSFTCALMMTGIVRCWGADMNGQLGDGRIGVIASVPTAGLALGSGAIAIIAGDSHACALTADGALHCWGANNLGQLGDATTADARLDPVTVVGIAPVCAAPILGEP